MAVEVTDSIPTTYERLANVQRDLKAPKNQYNGFGKYNYRNAEDILAAAKPLCIEHGLVLLLHDSIEMVGDRFYVKATATVVPVESNDPRWHGVSAVAYAREDESKTGMDRAQVTGSASSYARKYALNGLFAIDDGKDADSEEHAKVIGRDKVSEPAGGQIKKADPKQVLINQIKTEAKAKSLGPKDVQTMLSVESLNSLNIKELTEGLEKVKAHGSTD
ncbi:ERF family ssDNA binding protein [Gordonia phage Keelan]|nr:ERF family ssDNA binding protein [Gordonia phage Keelan]